MLRILAARLHQGHRTSPYPDVAPELPDRFRGLPVLNSSRCAAGCTACVDACATDSIRSTPRGLEIDLGRCLFCDDCASACPEGALTHSGDYRLAVRSRGDLVLHEGEGVARAAALDDKMRRLFGRSLKLRQVSAGGCNACEADVNVLSTVVFDLGRFGTQIVASPRHADGILITGPVTANMRLALQKTYDAVPAPKLVIAVGACAIAGGPYVSHPEVLGGADTLLPTDLYVPGCPPHPYTILDGLLRLLGRVEGNGERTPTRLERLRSAAVQVGTANIQEWAQIGRPRAESAAASLGVLGDQTRRSRTRARGGAPNDVVVGRLDTSEWRLRRH